MSLIGAWVLVLSLTTVLAWQIVGAADDRVSDRPVSPLNVAAPVLPTTADPPSTTSPTTTALGGDGSPPATTIPETSGTATSPQPTTTSPGSDSWSIKSIATSGGTVVVKYRDHEVILQTATPAPGFKTEVEQTGPPEVKVEFESETSKVEIRAKAENGVLDVDTSNHSESDS
jgi:hypothetical protein